MKRASAVRLALAFAVIAWVMTYVPAAWAQDFTTSRSGGRAGTWEFSLPFIYTDSATIDGGNGSSVEINEDWGWGFGFGYNFSDHFQLNGLLSFSSRSYDATVVQDDGTTRRYSNYLDTSTISLNGVYYLLKGNITPFISGGIGWTYVDTNIATGPSSGTCWWDPWWGYVCDSYTPTRTEEDWSYNAGIGLRFDVTRHFSLQAGYNKMWIEIDNASGTPDFNVWRFDLLFRM